MRTLEIKRSYISGMRTEFKLEEDQYQNWVMLAALSGRFAFAMEQGKEGDDGDGYDGENLPMNYAPKEAYFKENASKSSPAKAIPFDEAGYGELVLCPPGMKLKRRVVEPLSFLFIEFATELALPQGKLAVRDLQRLESTYRYMRIACARSEGGEDKEYIRHFVSDLLAILSLELASSADRSRRTKQDPVMARVLLYLEQHALEYGWNISQLADELGIGPSHLTRRFQQYFSQSPIEYVTSLRLQKARSLLVETDDTLDHIAEQCGYQNAFYFSRMFKSKCKINPSDYRRNHRF
ncbi:helix-turn-helix domain-containing protein [Paenibacillus sinopodophylli]|uniref:helix-turn-helix domain-containing protein n=1 Tax=Paenibacillus sinopodophylli TaxID=1837342 RepID=UPI001486495D|nr:helix-turn-helix transcriptional regulator [Paenibacillus sinopodophylli]